MILASLYILVGLSLVAMGIYLATSLMTKPLEVRIEDQLMDGILSFHSPGGGSRRRKKVSEGCRGRSIPSQAWIQQRTVQRSSLSQKFQRFV